MRDRLFRGPFQLAFSAIVSILCAGCGTQINTLAKVSRNTSGAAGVPPDVTSLALLDGPVTNAAPLRLDWGIEVGERDQYCLLENSTNKNLCVWRSGALPADYPDSASDGPFVLTAFVRNAFGTSPPIVSNAIAIDRTPPDLASVSVTNGTPTNSTTFGLAYGAVTGTYSEYCVLVNSTDRSACSWSAGTVPPSVTVASGDGPKTVRVWLKDDAGNSSAPVAASGIVLDQTLPTLTLTSLTGGQTLAGGSTANITWTGSDLYPAASPIALEYSDDSGSAWHAIAGPLADSGSYSWTVPSVTSTSYRVRVSFTDEAGNVRRAASNSDFRVNSSTPSIAITSPDGGEIWKGGASHAITWTSAGLPAGGATTPSVKLEYSLDNGSTWIPITASTPNDGAEAWTLPAATDATQALVRASLTDSFGVVTTDVSNANFRIDSTAPTIALTSLIGGQVVGGGAATAVTWSGSDANPGSGPIALEYSADSGATWNPIASGLANSGTSSWTTPAVTSTTYRVRVAFTDAVGFTAASSSTSDFSINSSTPVVSVTSPAGSEIWKSGSAHPITWSSSGLPTGGPNPVEAKLEYSLDNGGAWTTIAAATANDGSEAWTLPSSTDANQALVRVSVTDSFGAVTSGVSNSVFKIDSTAPSVTLTSLTGGDVVHGGEPYDVTWSASDANLAANPISILISADGGSTYSAIASGIVNSGTYSWSVPGTNASTYRVKIVAVDEAGNSGEDASAADFSIGFVPASIAIVSGNGQTHAVGAALSSDFVVVVKDSAGRAIENAAVDWSVLSGGGSLSSAANATDGSGESASRLTLSTAPGANSVQAILHDDPSLSVTFSATGGPDAVDHFALTSVPSSVVAGDEFTFTITAKDRFENTVTDYAGTVRFTSTDVHAVLPADYAFTVGDAGIVSDRIFVLRTAGTETVTVTQISGSSPSSSTSSITVTGSPALAWNITTMTDFGSVIVGSDSYTQDFYFLNTGIAAATGCAAPVLVGTNPGDFSIVSDACGSSDLIPDGSCKVQVKASPTVGGARNATLRRVCSVGGTINTSLKVTGTTTWVTALATGATETMAVLNDGTLRGWGWNASASLGDGTKTQRNTPISPTGLGTDNVQVSAGTEFSCVLLSGGTVKCVGRDYEGQLGDQQGYHATSYRSSYVGVYGITDALEIATGYQFACARLSAGGVKCWGDNGYSQLGDGTTSQSGSPVSVAGISTASRIAAGEYHACVLLSDKTVKCWGRGSSGQIGDGGGVSRTSPRSVSSLANVEQIVSGDSHVCARLGDGTVKCWGDNTYGQLGDTTTTNRKSPVGVSGLANAIDLAAFGSSTCAIETGGDLYCWGKNANGQLGDGTTVSRSAPVFVLSGVGALARGGGNVVSHHCVILASKSTRCWGKNDRGQLGTGTPALVTVPTQVSALASGNVKQVVTGGEHSCVLMTDETVKCWGSYDKGRLGDPAITAQTATPNTVPGLTGVKQLAAGNAFVCALLSDTTVKCWGFNGSSQLGNDSTADSNVPVSVLASNSPAIPITGVAQISAAWDHACLVTASGNVRCWGNGGYGRLGTGDQSGQRMPASTGITNGVEVATAYNSGCARLTDGTVKCWGSDNNGNLGQGTTNVQKNSPIAVPGLSNVTKLISSYGTYYAFLANGTMKCWGANGSGQCGNGLTADLTSPTTISGMTNISELGVGSGHACAKYAGKSVKCWGSNSTAQLGDGSVSTRLSPIAPIDAPAVFSVMSPQSGGANGSGHSCIVADADRSVWCWGNNGSSQSGAAPDLAIRAVSGGL